MRILITNTGPWGTGSGTLADGVLNELRSRGHEVVAFFPDTGLPGAGYDKYYGAPEYYKILPFPVVHKGVYLYTFPLIIRDPNPRNYPGAWTFKDMSHRELEAYFDYVRQELALILEEFQPDVVECQHIWAIDHVLRDLGYHYICVAHHSDQLGYLYDPRMRPISRKSARFAEFIIAISDYVRREVLDLYRVDSNRVLTMANGYDQSVFVPQDIDRGSVCREFDIEHREELPIVTFCGKISPTKGIDILLRANRLIQERHKALLLLIGSGRLEDFGSDTRSEFHLENVVTLGHRTPEEISRLHNVAHLSVMPSRSEGFGIAALEAMGCGIPLAATRVGGLGSLAVGELVEPGDPRALAAAILNVLEMPEGKYRALRDKALTTARTYSWSSVIDKRLACYEKVAELNRRRRRRRRVL